VLSFSRRLDLFTTSLPAVIYQLSIPKLGEGQGGLADQRYRPDLDLRICALAGLARLPQPLHGKLCPSLVQHPDVLPAGDLPVVPAVAHGVTGGFWRRC